MNWLDDIMYEGDGLDSLGAEDELGFDYMKLAGAAGGLLSGLSGGGGAGGGGGQLNATQAAAQARLQTQKEAAEASASRTKLILILVGVLAAVGGIGFVMSRRQSA